MVRSRPRAQPQERPACTVTFLGRTQRRCEVSATVLKYTYGHIEDHSRILVLDRKHQVSQNTPEYVALYTISIRCPSTCPNTSPLQVFAPRISMPRPARCHVHIGQALLACVCQASRPVFRIRPLARRQRRAYVHIHKQPPLLSPRSLQPTVPATKRVCHMRSNSVQALAHSRRSSGCQGAAFRSVHPSVHSPSRIPLNLKHRPLMPFIPRPFTAQKQVCIPLSFARGQRVRPA